jgi:hypothetical protein
MHAQDGKIVHINLWYSFSNELILLQPELPGVWLGLGVECPVVSDILILEGNLAAVTSIAP